MAEKDSYIKTPVKATAEILNKAEANMKHECGFIKGTLPVFTITHMPSRHKSCTLLITLLGK